MSNLFEHCRTEISSASQRYEKPEAMQINLLFAEAKYSRCSQSAISLCQSAAGGGCFAPQRCTLSWPLSVDDRRIPPFSPCPIFCYFGSDPKAGKGDSTVLFIRYVAGRSLRRTPSAGLRGRRLRPARRKGAATPDSGRAADRTEETSAGKRRER